MADVLRLDLGTGDGDSLSLFDVDTYRGPDVLGPVPPPIVLPARCPACHGRTDDVSPRCTCDRQPDGVAEATSLDLGEIAPPPAPTVLDQIAAGRMLPCCGGPTRPDRHLIPCPTDLPGPGRDGRGWIVPPAGYVDRPPVVPPTKPGPRCPSCHQRGDDRPTSCKAGRCGTVAHVEEHQDVADLDPAAARRARIEAHRARCSGLIMAPVFGIGRTSCGVCDFGPDDEEA